MPSIIIPVFLSALFLFFIYRIPALHNSTIDRNWNAGAFLLKAVAGCANYYIWLHVIGHGDSYRYIHDSLLIYDQLWQHPAWYFELLTRTSLQHVPEHLLPVQHSLYIEWHVPEYNMVRLYAILNIFSFGNAWGNIVILAFISFTASTALLKTLLRFFSANAKLLFAVLFCIPSIVFWSSGLLKEGPTLILLSIVFIQLLQLEKTFHIKNLLWLVIASALLFMVRDYLFILLVPNVILFFFIIRLKKNKFTMYAVVSAALVILIFILPFIIPKWNIFPRLKNEQAYFLINAPDPDYQFQLLNGSAGNVIANIPFALNNIFFRPNFLHSHSMYRMYQSIELIFIWCFLAWQFFKRRPGHHSVAVECILFLSAEVLFVYGLIVPDADALSRYRSVPLLFILLIASLRSISRKQKIPETPANTL